MSTLAITARFPLGTYLGHVGAGQRSEFPDTARLVSALTHSAGKGSLAVERDGDLRISDAAAAALRWLEEHPPSAIGVPISLPVSDRAGGPTMAFRDEGVHDTAGSAPPRRRKVPKPQSDAVAVDGVWGWGWDEDAPDTVVETIRALCEDVSCLGETDSPVVLEVADFAPTHVRDHAATGFAPRGGIPMRTPLPGRLDELEESYDGARPRKGPSAAQDRHSWSRLPEGSAQSHTRVIALTYRPVRRGPVQLPWTRARALPLGAPIDTSDRVRWAVAMHRAIAANLGEAAPPLVTGQYARTAPRPANRIAVHIVTTADLSDTDLPRDRMPYGAVVVMAPPDADPADMVLLERALKGIRRLYQSGHAVTLDAPVDIDPAYFWALPQTGKVRLWCPVPALVAETRRPRGDRSWGLNEAALLSVGHAFRDRFAASGRGEARYRAIVNAVRDHGVRAHDLRLVADSRTERYVHRVHDDLMVTPFTGLLDLHQVLPDTGLCALGQSRHLGGGLLLPVDLPHEVAVARYGVTR